MQDDDFQGAGHGGQETGQGHAIDDRPAPAELEAGEQGGEGEHLQPDQHTGCDEIEKTDRKARHEVDAERPCHGHDDAEAQYPWQLAWDRFDVGRFAHRGWMIRADGEKRQHFHAKTMEQRRRLGDGGAAHRCSGWEPSMPSLFQIVANTPLWVWPLMAFVLWLGLQGLRPRVVPWWRLAILPAVGLATSLAGIAQSAHPTWAATGWALALLAFLPLGWAFGQDRPVRLRPEDGRLEIAGGWFALVFGVAIFAVRYAMGVLFGVLPMLRAEPLWIYVSGAVGGMIAGIGIGWLANLLRRARRSTRVAPCA